MKFTEIEQIKNFEYTVACTDMALSDSKKILASVGTYRPAVKTHDLINLTQKNERHLEVDSLRVEILDRDAEKLCLLREDSVLEFHAKYGMHEKIKLPKKGHDIKYNNFNAEVLCAVPQNIFRFNLEHGRFMKPYLTTIDSPTSVCINKINGFIGLCGSKKIQFIDQRTSAVISTTNFLSDFTSMDFSENGINFSVGSEEGNVFLFDLRSKNPLDHYKHESYVKKVKARGKYTISADNAALKIFKEGIVYAEISINVRINTFEVCEGVLFVGCDAPKIRTFYSCEFGDIPEWCKIVKVEE